MCPVSYTAMNMHILIFSNADYILEGKHLRRDGGKIWVMK